MKLYSYVITHDTGFSPNPFWGHCTLANCKPKIRLTAEIGDWIVGLSPKASGNHVVFAMEVEEILDYGQYFRDQRFADKIPDYTKGKAIFRRGDNIYKPLPNDQFRQLPSRHSNKDQEDPVKKAHDLGGVYVLVGSNFHYFGPFGPELPGHLDALKVGIGYKCRFKPEIISSFLEFIAAHPKGVNYPPTKWPDGDTSWRQG